MRAIQILDCTLRDGGYCNNWFFGKKNICDTSTNLIEAGIEYVEIGLLSSKAPHNEESSNYASFFQMENIRTIINSKMNYDVSSQLLCMINHGDYNISNLPTKCDFPLGGIRYAFHRKDLYSIYDNIIQLINKGFRIFLQPMQTSKYTREELSYLIRLSNELKVFSVYIVDSFGSISINELLQIVSVFDELLIPDIMIGFHSHDNSLRAYSNTYGLVNYDSKHSIIVDGCLAGIGRGAGNAKTEQICVLINELYSNKYILSKVQKAKELIVNNLNPIHPWGWSPYFALSAEYDSHPNYALFLQEHCVELEEARLFFDSMHEEEKEQFDQSLINSWINNRS